MELKKMSKEEKESLFQKCLNVKLNGTGGSKWMELNAACDYPFVDGERLRCWFKAEAKRRIEEQEGHFEDSQKRCQGSCREGKEGN